MIKGRKINAYPACAPEVTLAGAEFVRLPFESALTDGNLVTGPAWTAHVAWLQQFLQASRISTPRELRKPCELENGADERT